jgi:hypothetical protein
MVSFTGRCLVHRAENNCVVHGRRLGRARMAERRFGQ